MRVIADIPSDGASGELVMGAARAIELVVGINLLIMKRLRVPSLYTTDVVYRLEPPGPEEIANCLQVLGKAPRVNNIPGPWGDCDDLVAYRVAELRFRGEKAVPRIVWRKDTHLYHAQVRRGDGSIEDPSMHMRRTEQERKDHANRR
jgi:hypothetical protein